MKWLDDLQKKLNVKSWLPDYKINKWIFRSALILIVLFFLVAYASAGFPNPNKTYIYVSCDSDSFGACENPFYNLCNVNGDLYYQYNKVCDDLNSSYYDNKLLSKGQSFGEEPPFLLTCAFSVWISLIVFAFVINHFIYNRKYFKNWKKRDSFFKDFGGENERI